MATAIGISTKVKDALNMIDFEGVSPVVKYHGNLYVIQTDGRDLGNLYYTVFKNATTPLYSITIPFSFADMMGQLFDKGDNLRTKETPRLKEFPALAYSVFYSHPIQEDILNPASALKALQTIVKPD